MREPPLTYVNGGKMDTKCSFLFTIRLPLFTISNGTEKCTQVTIGGNRHKIFTNILPYEKKASSKFRNKYQ